LAPGSALADPVALAVDLVGDIDPEVELFGEMESGQKFTLADSATLEFLHYTTCQNVIVQGGRLSFSKENFRVRGGKIVDVKRAKCPERVKLSAEGTAAGVTTRGTEKDLRKTKLKLRRAPTFVVVGVGARGLKRIKVYRGQEEIFKGELTGTKFAWPEDSGPLEAGDDYKIELSNPDGSVEHSFEAKVEDKRGKAPLAIIRVE
jgi:hypothetical protein